MLKNLIIQAEKKLLQAIRNSDIGVLDALLHDDLLFNLPNGQTITKAFDLDSYRSGKMHVNSLEATDQMIQVFEDSAVVCVTLALQGTYDGHAMDGIFRYIRVWKKFGENFKVIAGSAIPFG
jgi:ketosteroid isomerase-like protein